VHDLAHEFTSRKVSPWGGIKFFHKTYQSTGLPFLLEELDLPYPGSNRGYQPVDLMEGFMVSVVLGARRLAHSGMLRSDEVIQSIFGWQKGMASASTFSRFFGKFDIDRNDSVFPAIMKYWFDQQSLKKMTVDIDSTVITRYGHQQGVEKGYNPGKKGAVSHHPLLAFCDELKMVLNAWMRSGDSHSSQDAIGFLEELTEIVSPERIGLLRGDSGFYSDQIFRLLEDRPKAINYLVKAKMTTRLRSAILSIEDFHGNNEVRSGNSYSEIFYQAKGWKKARRMVIVRQPVENKDRQQKLYREDRDQSAYEYYALVTNTDLAAVKIHSLYNQRADCENRIKELKYDYAIDGFALQDFAGMEAAFRMIMVAYNVMALFRQQVMTSRKAHQLSTIRFQCIAIGSYLIKSGRNKKMKLSAEGKRRHFLEHFFDNLEHLKPPFQFPIA
jgi:hypothetical protein